VVVELVKLIMFPCWVFPYMFKEYVPVINLSSAKNSIKYKENDVEATISMISLNRLIDGGAAMFTAVYRNHHIVIVGRNLIMPFIKNILRVCKIS
jgi:hypothetical protein